MKTQPAKETSRTTDGIFHALRSWRPLVLAALLPLAMACTDTVTGLDRGSQDTEAPIDDSSESTDDGLPVAL